MSPPVELLIGLRYVRAKRRNHFIGFISIVSMLGIAIGVMALIVVLSVMNGFQKELRARILGVVSHVQISGPDHVLRQWREVEQRVLQHPGVLAAAPYVLGQGMLTHQGRVQGVVVRGIDPAAEIQVADVGRHMRAGSLEALQPGEFGIVLGIDLARLLGVFPGDKVVLVVPQGMVTPAGVLPRLKQFTVTGVFEVGMYEYDSGFALVHLADAQALFRLGEAVSGVRLKLDDLFAAPRMARELSAALPGDLYVSDWTRQHSNFFRAVEIEKRVMFIILTLIVAVAAFNIVSTLVMVVTDKRADIAILRTMGASPGSITGIFMVQGSLIGVIGTLLGVVGGVLLAWNVDVVVPFIESLFGIQFLAKDVYQISELPSELQSRDVFTIAGVSLALSLLATLYPSFRASRVNPAEALRYE